MVTTNDSEEWLRPMFTIHGYQDRPNDNNGCDDG